MERKNEREKYNYNDLSFLAKFINKVKNDR